MKEIDELAILEQPCAMRILVYLRDNPGKIRSELYSSVNCAQKTLEKRLATLIEEGLIEEMQSQTHIRGKLVYLTQHGHEVVKQIDPLISSLKGEDIRVEQTDHGATSTDGNKVS